MLSMQPPDGPINLNNFPTLQVGPGTGFTTVRRSHDAYNPDGTLRDPRFFSPMHITPTGQRRGGRFDLRHPLGTCNTGVTAAAALHERFAHRLTHSRAILSSDLKNVRVSTLRIRRTLRLLDVRHNGPGYTARDISDRHHRDTGYYLTQQFAQMAYEAGFDGIIGDLYSTAATCEYLGGITRQALNDRINKHTILRLKDGAGRNGYPIFQFSNGTVDTNIQQIIQTLLDGHFSEWQTALWITTPSLIYNGASPLEYLRTSPKHFGQVLAHAENDVNNLYANS